MWTYLIGPSIHERSDVIFVFGGNDLAVPAEAARLYAEQFAPIILVSGKAGPLTQDVFCKPEAIVFAQEMIRLGVPEYVILIEPEASNTGENVAFGMRVLAQHRVLVKSALLVAKPFLMRRCVATFARQFPSMITRPSPPPGDMSVFIDRSREDFILRLLAELDRLDAYAQKGFITPQALPEHVQTAAQYLRLDYSPIAQG